MSRAVLVPREALIRLSAPSPMALPREKADRLLRLLPCSGLTRVWEKVAEGRMRAASTHAIEES
jgi:hypothetical protein